MQYLKVFKTSLLASTITSIVMSPLAYADTSTNTVETATTEATAEVTELPTVPPSPTPNQEERIESFNESVDLFAENLKASDLPNLASGINGSVFPSQQMVPLEAAQGTAIVSHGDPA